jgi:hypothetical protein
MENKVTHYRYVRDYGFETSEDDGFFHKFTGKIALEEYRTIGETPKGYWITYISNSKFVHTYFNKRFVLKESRKRFAYPTKKEAFDSFKIRTKKSKEYAKRDLANAKDFLKLIEIHEKTL